MSDKKMNLESATALRRPFPKESVGQLPKGGQMLDFVGHAAVTDRLLAIDPEWTWEPFALDPAGLPALDKAGNLWLRLTVCGVTRIGVGDGKNAKEVISDGIRNAAMRFGVALDLWAKENLVEFAQAANGSTSPRTASPPAKQPTPPPESPLLDTGGKLAKAMFAAFNSAGIDDRDLRLAFVSETVGRTVVGSAELTDDDARAVTARLQAMLAEPFPAGGAA